MSDEGNVQVPQANGKYKRCYLPSFSFDYKSYNTEYIMAKKLSLSKDITTDKLKMQIGGQLGKPEF